MNKWGGGEGTLVDRVQLNLHPRRLFVCNTGKAGHANEGSDQAPYREGPRFIGEEGLA